MSARDKVLKNHQPSSSLRGLDLLNFFLADVQTGVGPFLAIYLAGYKWDEQLVGLALAVGSISGIIAQTPAGALVDYIKSKRALIAIGVVCLAICALLIAIFPSFWPVITAQAFIGSTSSIFNPAICAISLGIVGRKYFDLRQGRNQMFNSGGNVVAAIMMGIIGYTLSDRGIFFFVAILAIPTILALFLINPNEIDYEMARGSKDGKEEGKPAKLRELFKDHPLVIFLICAVLFHFANAAMLPLLGEMLSKGQGRSSMMFMSACVVTTQLVITLIASWCGREAGTWGRKPLLLIGFGVLPIRGLLYTLTNKTGWLVAIQLLDGIGAGIFNVVSVLVIADLTKGTGRFNLTLGAIITAIGIGASLSQVIAGTIVKNYGYNSGFVFLAAIALVAFITLYFFMPETGIRQNKPAKGPQ